jgi:hypothetical protein
LVTPARSCTKSVCVSHVGCAMKNLHVEHHGFEWLEVLQHCLVLEQSGINSVVLDAFSRTNIQLPAVVGVCLVGGGRLQSDKGVKQKSCGCVLDVLRCLGCCLRSVRIRCDAGCQKALTRAKF